jgi:hypothetical protein
MRTSIQAKAAIYLLTAQVVSVCAAYGAVQPVIYDVITGGSVTLPTSKALLIDNVYTTNAAMYLSKGATLVNIGGSFFKLRNNTTTSDSTVAFPLLVPPGWTIGGSGSLCVVFGRLVDLSDLYAGISNRIESISVNEGVTSLGVQLASAKPVRVSTEATADLALAWNAVSNAVVTRAADPARLTVAVPTNGPEQFYRTKTTPRR